MDQPTDWRTMPVFNTETKGKFKVGSNVITPLGTGEVINVGNTPAGPVYRVKVHGGIQSSDFFENQLIDAGDFVYVAARG